MTNEEEAGTWVVLEKGEFNEKLSTHHIVASPDSAERPLSAALVLAFALCSHSFLIFFHTRLFSNPQISRFSPSFNIYSWRAEQSHWDSLGRHSSEANFLKVLYFCFQGNALLPSPRAEPVKPPPSLQRFYKQKCFGRQLSPLGAEQARAPSQKNCQGWLNLLQWSFDPPWAHCDPPWAQARATPCSRPVAAQLNETHQLRLKPSDRTAPAPTAHCDQHKLQLK